VGGGTTGALLLPAALLVLQPLGEVITWGLLGGIIGGVLLLLLEFCLEWRGEVVERQ
jgi:hypothetical protein